ncbi:protein of unknown function [Moritella yayanosii]|uniref:Uncharacterized protein n=1 Tax=Moritella yayanosii TaxID=69539 RepID=A0A330LNQ3_9GAMM|nr:protein of unknown function [Moritella yayanosii]
MIYLTLRKVRIMLSPPLSDMFTKGLSPPFSIFTPPERPK